MNIVRELVNVIGFHVNKSQLRDADNAVSRLGKRMQGIGSQMSMRLTAPIAALGLGMLKIAADYETAMNVVAVKSRATAEEMELLNTQARQLGATTQFSATQAANAMSFLAQAGFNAQEIMAAMPSTLNLAAAAGQDLATTADQLSNIMQGFGLNADQATRSADVLALAASSSNTDVAMLAEGMKYAAPIAHAMGMSLESTAAFMGMLGNAGIQASMAGTSLRMSLVKTIKQSKDAQEALDNLGVTLTTFDDNGEEVGKNFFEVLKELQESGAGIRELEAIFDVRAVTGIAAVMDQGIGDLEDFNKFLVEEAAGEASKQAGARMKGLRGGILNLISALQELSLTITDAGLLEWATILTNKLTKFIRKLSKEDKNILKFGTIVVGVIALMGPALWGLGTAIRFVSTAFVAMNGPLGIVAFGIIALLPLLSDLAEGFLENIRAGESFGDAIKNVIASEMPELDRAINNLGVSFGKLKESAKDVFGDEFALNISNASKSLKEFYKDKSLAESFLLGLVNLSDLLLISINSLIESFDKLIGYRDKLFGEMGDFFKTLFPGFKTRDELTEPISEEDISKGDERLNNIIDSIKNALIKSVEPLGGESYMNTSPAMAIASNTGQSASTNNLSKSINVNANIVAQVPPGTSQQQSESLKSQIDESAYKISDAIADTLYNDNSGY